MTARPPVELATFMMNRNFLDGVTVFRILVSAVSALPLTGIIDIPTPVAIPVRRAFFIFGLLNIETFPRTDDIAPVPTLIKDCGTLFIVSAILIALLRDERDAFDNEMI